MRKVQILRYSLYISWSSLDGLLVCLLWCRFSEFRIIRGGCRRTAQNLVDSLRFSWVLCRWSEIWKLTRYGLIYCEMHGIRVIRVIGGRIERNLVDSLQFSWVLCRWSEIWNVMYNVNKWCEFCRLCGRIARNLRNSLEFCRVLCRWSEIWNVMYNVNKMCEFCLICGLYGRIAWNLRNLLDFWLEGTILKNVACKF